jgi:hypothetical protein
MYSRKVAKDLDGHFSSNGGSPIISKIGLCQAKEGFDCLYNTSNPVL